jgi:prevent-host-death family protein
MEMVMYTSHVEVNATLFKAKCLSLIDHAQATGEAITITKRGRVVAKLVAASDASEKPWLALRDQPVAWHGDPFAPVISEDEIEALR